MHRYHGQKFEDMCVFCAFFEELYFGEGRFSWLFMDKIFLACLVKGAVSMLQNMHEIRADSAAPKWGRVTILHFHLYVNSSWKIQAHERINRALGWIYDINNALMYARFVLIA